MFMSGIKYIKVHHIAYEKIIDTFDQEFHRAYSFST